MDTRTAICNYLKKHHVGRDNAVHCNEIEKLFGIDRRTVQRSVNLLRREGFAICSDQNGYYYADNQKEIDATIKRLNSQVQNMSTARNGMLYASIIIPSAEIVVININGGDTYAK